MQRLRSIPHGNTKISRPSSKFRRRGRTWSFHVLVLRRTAKKSTKIYKARAQLLFCSLNLLFGDVLVAVVVVACLSSLMAFVAELLRAKRASEAPWVRKFGIPASRENLVMTSAYERASQPRPQVPLSTSRKYPTSFPGSSPYLEKVPWLRLVSCLLDFSRFQRCD